MKKKIIGGIIGAMALLVLSEVIVVCLGCPIATDVVFVLSMLGSGGALGALSVELFCNNKCNNKYIYEYYEEHSEEYGDDDEFRNNLVCNKENEPIGAKVPGHDGKVIKLFERSDR